MKAEFDDNMKLSLFILRSRDYNGSYKSGIF